MENQLTTTTHQTAYTGDQLPKVDKVIVHTATSCYLIDNVLCTIHGENATEVANLIINMHKSIQQAKAFIAGFEDDEAQTGIPALLEQLSSFDIK